MNRNLGRAAAWPADRNGSTREAKLSKPRGGWILPRLLAACLPFILATAVSAERARFIAAQQIDDDLSNRTQSLVANQAHIDALPFDGITIHVPATDLVMSRFRYRYEEYYDEWFAPLEGLFDRVTENYLVVNVRDPGDLFDDDAWSTTIDNWRDAARAVRDSGLIGIYFDTEEYFDPWLNFPEDYDAPQQTVQQYADQARLRGRQIMEAVVEEFPGIEMLALHGAYLSERKNPPYVTKDQVGNPAEYELLGPLLTGMLEGSAPQTRFIDGGEVYQNRTAIDYQTGGAWRRYGMASEWTDSLFVTPNVRSLWRERMEIAHSVYNLSWPDPIEDLMTPAILEESLTHALRSGADTVWFWTEEFSPGVGDWLLPGSMPDAWLQATEAALAAAESPAIRLEVEVEASITELPAAGGPVQIPLSLTNDAPTSWSGLIWTTLVLPSGEEIIDRTVALEAASGEVIERTVQLDVPPTLQSGFYVLVLQAGPSTDRVVSAASVSFTKTTDP